MDCGFVWNGFIIKHNIFQEYSNMQITWQIDLAAVSCWMCSHWQGLLCVCFVWTGPKLSEERGFFKNSVLFCQLSFKRLYYLCSPLNLLHMSLSSLSLSFQPVASFCLSNFRFFPPIPYCNLGLSLSTLYQSASPPASLDLSSNFFPTPFPI